MDKAQLKEEILNITDWRHPFEVEPGVWTTLFRDWFKDWHLWRVENLMPNIETIARCLLPDGIKGAKVLDVGCWDGFYGFEFIKRGAASLKGIDLREEAVRRANLLKEYYQYPNCQFEAINIQDKAFEKESFDISLLFGVLYHLSAPIDVLKTIGNITGSMVLLSTYASGERDPILKLKREDPDKDSTGFQELITTPSEAAVVEMLDFAGFDVVLRDYPFPFFERYRNSNFGFFCGIKSSAVAPEKLEALFKELKVWDHYRPGVQESQIVRLYRQRPTENGMKRKICTKLGRLADKIF